ncbi:MAG TPA: PAS domain S-box protein, partial [Methanocorpusculum sp.]|nr:PAS domain S-box protein [Methanocorpusculum sp.]
MTDTDTGVSEILSLLKENPRGLSVSEVADALHINRNTTARYLDKLLISGRVEMRTFGKAKVFFVSKRVPVSAMLNLSSEMVLIVNADLMVIQANSAALVYLSCAAEDLIGKPVYEGYGQKLCCGELTEQIRSALRGASVRDELRVEENEGDVIFEIRIFPLVLPDGNQGATLLLEDITSRRKTEEQLAESNAQFRRILETVRDIFWTVDADGSICYISPGVFRTLGYSAEDLIGKPFSTLMPERDAERFAAEMQSAQAKTSGFSLHEFQIRGKDGSMHYADFTASPLYSDKENKIFSGYSGALHDVTGRHEAELSEKRWRLFLNGVIENIPAIVTVSDLSDGTYYYANREAEQFLRRSRNELMHMTIHHILAEIHAYEMEKALASAKEKREKVMVK